VVDQSVVLLLMLGALFVVLSGLAACADHSPATRAPRAIAIEYDAEDAPTYDASVDAAVQPSSDQSQYNPPSGYDNSLGPAPGCTSVCPRPAKQ
jgi:hypothetical protein